MFHSNRIIKNYSYVCMNWLLLIIYLCNFYPLEESLVLPSSTNCTFLFLVLIYILLLVFSKLIRSFNTHCSICECILRFLTFFWDCSHLTLFHHCNPYLFHLIGIIARVFGKPFFYHFRNLLKYCWMVVGLRISIYMILLFSFLYRWNVWLYRLKPRSG